MRRRIIKIVIQLFYILTVIPLRVTQAEIPFLNDRILLIPESYRETQQLLVIANPAYSFLTPAVCLTPGEVMSDIGPGVAMCTIILAHGTPLAVAHIRLRLFPGRVLKSFFFFAHK